MQTEAERIFKKMSIVFFLEIQDLHLEEEGKIQNQLIQNQLNLRKNLLLNKKKQLRYNKKKLYLILKLKRQIHL